MATTARTTAPTTNTPIAVLFACLLMSFSSLRYALKYRSNYLLHKSYKEAGSV
jgi:hypothetical protein